MTTTITRQYLSDLVYKELGISKVEASNFIDDIFEFLNHVEDGLKDHYDIKMLTYLMLVRLSTLCPNALLQSLLIIIIMTFFYIRIF